MLLEKGSWGLVILISLVVVLEEEFLGTGRWQYDNAVARFPLYLLGMHITTYFPHVLCSSPSK